MTPTETENWPSQAYPDAVNRFRGLGFEIDIYIPSIKTAIEYDGAYYHKTKNLLKKDNEKGVLCYENGIKLIRVRDKKLPHAFKYDDESYGDYLQMVCNLE